MNLLLQNLVAWINENNFITDTEKLDVYEDGAIDTLSILHVGQGDWADLLWPRFAQYTGDTLRIGDKVVKNFTLQSLGTVDNPNNYSRLGTIVHEFAHSLGTLDFYSYDYIQESSVAPWDIMATSNGGFPTQYLKAKYLGWDLDEIVVATSGEYIINNTQSPLQNVIIINTDSDDEQIYVEYRSKSGDYDINLPDSGVIVYRVNTHYYGNTEGYQINQYNIYPCEVHVFSPSTFDQTRLDDENRYVLSNSDGIHPSYDAAMNFNTYTEIGYGTTTPLFDSRGYELKIKITLISMNDDQVKLNVEFFD